MKKTIIAVIVVAVITFTAGLYIGDTYGIDTGKTGKTGTIKTITPKEKGDYKNTFADGWEAARQEVKKSGQLMSSPGGEIRHLSGNIKEIKGKKIVFSTYALSPLDPEELKTRTVEVGDDTKLVFYRKLTRDEMETKRTAGEKKMKELRLQLDADRDDFEECANTEMEMMEGETNSTSSINRAKICNKTREDYYKMQNEEMELSMNMHNDSEKVENAKIGDFKAGYSISVSTEGNDGMEGDEGTRGQDISEAMEFVASRVEIREIRAEEMSGEEI